MVSVDGGTCVTPSALRDAVEIRGGKVSDDANVRLRVRVDPRRDGQVGVEIAGQGTKGPLADRRFVASSCADAVAALGLVIALAADGEESSERSPEPAPAMTSSPASIRDRDESTSKTAPAIDEGPRTPTVLALRAGAVGTTFGRGQPGARIGVAFEWNRTFFPWIEASATLTFPHTIEAGGGGADPRFVTGRLAVAPVRFRAGESWRLALFGAFDAGALAVAGSGPARVESRSRAWLALAAGARIRWDFGARVFAGLEAAAVVPMMRDDFVFLNGGSAYRVPAVGAETAIFAGVHFP